MHVVRDWVPASTSPPPFSDDGTPVAHQRDVTTAPLVHQPTIGGFLQRFLGRFVSGDGRECLCMQLLPPPGDVFSARMDSASASSVDIPRGGGPIAPLIVAVPPPTLLCAAAARADDALNAALSFKMKHLVRSQKGSDTMRPLRPGASNMLVGLVSSDAHLRQSVRVVVNQDISRHQTSTTSGGDRRRVMRNNGRSPAGAHSDATADDDDEIEDDDSRFTDTADDVVLRSDDLGHRRGSTDSARRRGPIHQQQQQQQQHSARTGHRSRSATQSADTNIMLRSADVTTTMGVEDSESSGTDCGRRATLPEFAANPLPMQSWSESIALRNAVLGALSSALAVVVAPPTRFVSALSKHSRDDAGNEEDPFTAPERVVTPSDSFDAQRWKRFLDRRGASIVGSVERDELAAAISAMQMPLFSENR